MRVAGAAIAIGVALGIIQGCGSGEGGVVAERPNVVFVVLDTLRADHLELYGYGDSTAPFLARVGERSAVFTQAFSTSSWTAPSTASLFTGLYPTRHGVTMGFMAKVRRRLEKSHATAIQVGQLPASVATLPEHMKRLGYRTYGVATNVNIGEAIGFDRGFDRFLSLVNEPAESVLETLRGWRAEIEAEPPYFLYLHLDDVHKPYLRRAPWFEESGDPRSDSMAAYDSEIHYVDGVLEQMLGLLGFDASGEKVGILVIASDHGEEFWDHGNDGHRFSLHYEVNRIALMWSGPGIRPGPRTDNASGVDVLPTLLDLVGAEALDSIDGRSLAPLLKEDETADQLRADLASRPLLAHRLDRRESDKQLWSVIVGPWKLIVSGKQNELYDLRVDSTERNDLSADEPQRVAALQAELAGFRRAKPIEPAGGTRVLLDADALEQLRALGYVDDDEASR